ncbi:hypothetical protein ATE84_3302 [Aquimarina sp. MAR_2010_214]|uniref:hypothetical protein n=1 Tax=Aquimarina sp. MAR_2010_214 TaxID=1250026 RepID=UPI000C70F2F9|nr:hypothetical protein [Aquimarina sp. MAR_2010_214]PKV51228.1 hypothetical protein ATE84_3302 [Aquimarina sp. MAR_2010_214]
MRKIFALLCLATFIFTSCSSDDDTDFDTIGQTFEIDKVDFIAPEYAVNIPFPSNIEVFDADVVLVYRLENVVDGRDVWEPVPTPLIELDNGGKLTYRFNFTINDVDILLDTPDINLIGANFTNDQVFRIVIVPSAFAKKSKVDLTDFKAVQKALKLKI